jgi:radical SAM superfamily enzyme YgiQ (UPF0313 family)
MQHIHSVLTDLDRRYGYELAAFSVNALTKHFTMVASQFLKSLRPERPVLFGGPLCFPTRYSSRFFEEEGAPNIILQGEAEIALPAFLAGFDTTGDYRTQVPGFMYQDRGMIVDTGKPELPDLESSTIVPDWSQFDASAYLSPGAFSTFLSRGCPGRCVFCRERSDYRRFRTRKPIDVLNEIKNIMGRFPLREAPTTIHFSDQLINGSMRKLEELCDLLIDEEMNIEWFALVRFREKMTRTILSKMRKAGCKAIFWGLESASNKVLNLMGKNYDHQLARRLVGEAWNLGIENYLPLIVGFPGETVNDFIQSIMFVIEFRRYAHFEDPNMLEITSNTIMYDEYRKMGLLNNNAKDWTTQDLRNDLHVRMLRKFVLHNVINNPSLNMHSVVGMEDLRGVDLNRPSVASEAASMLYGMWSLSGTEKEMMSVLTAPRDGLSTSLTMPEGALDYWHPENVPGHIRLDRWFALDKNSETVRNRLCTYLMEACRGAGDLVGSQ